MLLRLPEGHGLTTFKAAPSSKTDRRIKLNVSERNAQSNFQDVFGGTTHFIRIITPRSLKTIRTLAAIVKSAERFQTSKLCGYSAVMYLMECSLLPFELFLTKLASWFRTNEVNSLPAVDLMKKKTAVDHDLGSFTKSLPTYFFIDRENTFLPFSM